MFSLVEGCSLFSYVVLSAVSSKSTKNKLMNRNLLFILPIILINFSFGYQDKIKVFGKYKVIESKRLMGGTIKNFPNVVIEFEGESYFKMTGDDEKIRGTIKIIKVSNSSTILYLKDSIPNYQRTVVDTLSRTSFINRVMEFEDSKSDTIPFRTTLSTNLHITDTEGILVRLK
jgi:hypothetical protein